MNLPIVSTLFTSSLCPHFYNPVWISSAVSYIIETSSFSVPELNRRKNEGYGYSYSCALTFVSFSLNFWGKLDEILDTQDKAKAGRFLTIMVNRFYKLEVEFNVDGKNFGLEASNTKSSPKGLRKMSLITIAEARSTSIKSFVFYIVKSNPQHLKPTHRRPPKKRLSQDDRDIRGG